MNTTTPIPSAAGATHPVVAAADEATQLRRRLALAEAICEAVAPLFLCQNLCCLNPICIAIREWRADIHDPRTR